eukprot:COSAG05_NODE_232_length_13313_cov_677.565991_11_plen_123_part_00
MTRLIAAFARQTDASYHDIDTRNKKAGVSNPSQGGGSSRLFQGGGNSGNISKIDTSQADPSKDETSTKWSIGKEILHWATTANRLRHCYADLANCQSQQKQKYSSDQSSDLKEERVRTKQYH